MNLLSWEEDEDAGGPFEIVWRCWENLKTLSIKFNCGEGENPKPYFSVLLTDRLGDTEQRFHQEEAYQHLLLLSGEEMASNVVSFSLGKLSLKVAVHPYLICSPYREFVESFKKEELKFEAVKKEWKTYF